MTHFQIANARVGQAYQAKIYAQTALQQAVVLDSKSIDIPEQIGIAYDAEQGHFVGIPSQAGDFLFGFRYQQSDVVWCDGVCTLWINADPRSLWQVNEPIAGQPFAKVHSDHQWVEADQFQLLAASRRGRAHEHAGSF